MSRATRHTESIARLAEQQELQAALLYETVMDLAGEGMLTASCIDAAASVLLQDLGLPPYYFRTLSKPALTTALRVIATNLDWEADGHRGLNEEAAYLEASGQHGIDVLVACESNRAAMEAVAGERMQGRRWEYYYAPHTRYTTYIIKPEECPPLATVTAGGCRFAFSCISPATGFSVPQETGERYQRFLELQRASVSRLLGFSEASGTGETRILFHKSVAKRYLPQIRHLLAERGIQLNRAYGEPYRTDSGSVASVCAVYVRGKLDAATQEALAGDLRAFLALGENPFVENFLRDELSFIEMLFSVNLAFFVHQFIYRDLETDRQLMDSVGSQELREALSKRITDANHSEYTRRLIHETLGQNPQRLKELFALFDSKFNPARAASLDAAGLQEHLRHFERAVTIQFANDVTGLEIMRFATRIITHTLKTNFYRPDKRSYAYRVDSGVLDPVVFPSRVYGIFFVLGHYALGTHMRAEDIARGGLRLLRVTPANYENELDAANLLNYALGPMAQRLKHKDIAESGAKGVIVPAPEHARDALDAIHDFSEGIMDLIQPDAHVVDYLGRPEMVFFGPDEGTAALMDAVARRARERGYRYWRTLTTGKSIGLPHDTYGITAGGKVFGLLDRGAEGTEVQLEGRSLGAWTAADAVISALGDGIETSGMTTTGIMACFRTLTARCGLREEDLDLLITGGPDGDLGANQVQCYKGRICLLIDSGAVLFDPDGLNREALLRLAVSRHTQPRLNSTAFPVALLGPRGFLVRRTDRNVTLPDGTLIEDGAFFHSHVLTAPESQTFLRQANLRAFIPCGGQKDTINFANVRAFLRNFPALRLIVEGANVFFDDSAREVIARESAIVHIKDSTANKGGVTSSSLAEVLTAFLLGEDYERLLVDDMQTRFRLVRELLGIVSDNARAETTMLLDLHAADPTVPLYRLSVQTSERLLAFQERLRGRLSSILADPGLVRRVVLAYVPSVLVEVLGAEQILARLNAPELQAYRDAILTKKLAALALYRHAVAWEAFLAAFEKAPVQALQALASD
jgi:glutamate dehydrogenase